MTTMVGMLRASYRWLNARLSSTLTLMTLSRPGNSRASCSRIGDTKRQGPHHGAHRSTRTVAVVCASISNVASVASTTHGSGLPQVPQCGAPRGLGRIVLRAPQLAQTMIETGPELRFDSAAPLDGFEAGWSGDALLVVMRGLAMAYRLAWPCSSALPRVSIRSHSLLAVGWASTTLPRWQVGRSRSRAHSRCRSSPSRGTALPVRSQSTRRWRAAAWRFLDLVATP